jgi:LAO/AO transport system kinase
MTTDEPSTELISSFRAGDRRALARAITMVESTRPDHREAAVALLDELLPDTGNAIRIGISGPPGVGKSTFIEAFGMHVVEQGKRLAVLAVDPSSSRSGGSILGDKTRMTELARQPNAFIRPTPGGEHLGGVARRTREAMLLCEAFGFDVVIIETIGVGQSEIAVADMVDLFILLVNPGSGDELQGIKRGIMELADIVLVNKADGDLAAAASRTSADHTNALHLLRPKWKAWTARSMKCSARDRVGIAEVWDAVGDFQAAVSADGELDALRARQALAWMWSEVHDDLLDDFKADAGVRGQLASVERAVADGTLAPAAAARRLLDAFERADDHSATDS